MVTADKGLAGAYNHNIVKLEEEILAKPGIHKLFIVGELGRHYFAKRGVEIDTNFQYTVQKPTMHRAGISPACCWISSQKANWMRSTSCTPGWRIPSSPRRR